MKHKLTMHLNASEVFLYPTKNKLLVCLYHETLLTDQVSVFPYNISMKNIKQNRFYRVFVNRLTNRNIILIVDTEKKYKSVDKKAVHSDIYDAVSEFKCPSFTYKDDFYSDELNEFHAISQKAVGVFCSDKITLLGSTVVAKHIKGNFSKFCKIVINEALIEGESFKFYIKNKIGYLITPSHFSVLRKTSLTKSGTHNDTYRTASKKNTDKEIVVNRKSFISMLPDSPKTTMLLTKNSLIVGSGSIKGKSKTNHQKSACLNTVALSHVLNHLTGKKVTMSINKNYTLVDFSDKKSTYKIALITHRG